MKHIVLTGGGTAGHVTPNIALIPRLQELGYQISYIGSYNGMKKTDRGNEDPLLRHFFRKTAPLFRRQKFHGSFSRSEGVLRSEKADERALPRTLCSPKGDLLPFLLSWPPKNVKSRRSSMNPI